MDGKMLKPGERYLFRLKGKQVPVEFLGKFGAAGYEFRRLDTKERFAKQAARALSPHFDDCGKIPRCKCKQRLKDLDREDDPIEPYPEHAKLGGIRDLSQACGEFIEWLESEKKIHLAVWIPDPEDIYPDKLALSITSIADLLGEYFEIDRDKLEAEKRTMLDEIRKKNGGPILCLVCKEMREATRKLGDIWLCEECFNRVSDPNNLDNLAVLPDA